MITFRLVIPDDLSSEIFYKSTHERVIRRKLLIKYFTTIIIVLGIIYTTSRYINRGYFTFDLALAIFFILINIITHYINKFERSRIASWLFIFNVWALPLIGNYIVGHITILGFFALMPSILVAALLVTFSGIIFVAVFGLIVLVIVLNLPPPEILFPTLAPGALSETNLLLIQILYFVGIVSFIIIDRYNTDLLYEVTVESEQRYKELIQQSMDPIIVLNEFDKIVEVNHNFEKIANNTRDNLLGRKVQSLGDEDLQNKINRFVNAVRKNGYAEVKNELAFLKDVGKTYLSARGQLLKDNRILTVLKDKTNEVKRNEEIEHLRQIRINNSKLEVVGKLAGNIAHDFNNVLMAMSATADLNLMTREDEDDYQDWKMMKEIIDRAQSLTKGLLSYSKRRVSSPQVVNVNNQISKMKPMIDNLFAKDIQLEFNLAEQNTSTLIDPVQLEQIILNLLINAKEASLPDGYIEIRTELTNKPFVEYDLFDQKSTDVDTRKYVLLIVRDRGEGIEPDIHSKIFDPFFSKRGEGTGLGLNIIKNLVKKSGGHIRVDSIFGKGSAFYIYLPYVEASEDNLPIKETQMYNFNDLTVLLVDDEEHIRQAISKSLEDYGITMITASSVKQAKSIVEKSDIDLLLTDIVMPYENGLELVEWVSQFHNTIDVILMTGYSQDLLTNGFKDYLVLDKPFSIPKLLKTIKQRVEPE